MAAFWLMSTCANLAPFSVCAAEPAGKDRPFAKKSDAQDLLGEQDWSAASALTLNSNKVPRNLVVSYINENVTDEPPITDADLCSFGFFDFGISNKVILLASVASGRHFCNTVAALQPGKRPWTFDVWLEDDVQKIVKRAQGSRRALLVFEELWHPTSGMAWCNATWQRVFAPGIDGFIDVGQKYPELYRERLEDLIATIAHLDAPDHRKTRPSDSNDPRLESSCAVMEADRIKRYLGIDRKAGLNTAETWALSPDPLLRGNAIAVFQNINSLEARRAIAKLVQDPDRDVAAQALQAEHPSR